MSEDNSSRLKAEESYAGVPYIDYLPDDREVAISEVPAMKSRCVECPYTKGTDASNNPITLQMTVDCSRSGAPFFCHKSATAINLGFATHLCAGWIENDERPNLASLPSSQSEGTQ